MDLSCLGCTTITNIKSIMYFLIDILNTQRTTQAAIMEFENKKWFFMGSSVLIKFPSKVSNCTQSFRKIVF